MPKLFHIRDNQTGRVLVRKSLDAREIMGGDPTRYSPVGEAARLRPILHLKSAEDDGLPESVTAAPSLASSAPSPTEPAKKKQPSQATTAKRHAALAKARATAAANRAARAAQSQPAAE